MLTANDFLRTLFLTSSSSITSRLRTFLVLLLLSIALLPLQIQAQTCILTLKTLSGYYSVSEVSKTTVNIEVAWQNTTKSPTANDAADTITVTFTEQIKTINPGAYISAQRNGAVVSPQVVAFEVPADNTTQIAQVFIGASYGGSYLKGPANRHCVSTKLITHCV